MKDFKDSKWYQQLKELMSERNRMADSIFVAFYFNLLREPTKAEFTALWGSNNNYLASAERFRRCFEPFM